MEKRGQAEIEKYKYIVNKTIPALKRLIASEEYKVSDTLKAQKIRIMPQAKDKPKKCLEEIRIQHISDYEKLLRNNENYIKNIRKVVRKMNEPHKTVLLSFYFGGKNEIISETTFCMDHHVSPSTMNRMKKKAKAELGKLLAGDEV